MSKGTTGEAEVIRLRQNIQDLLHRRVLEAVQTVLEEELSNALGTSRYERSDDNATNLGGLGAEPPETHNEVELHLENLH